MKLRTESPIPLASSHPLFPVRLTARTDRALLESNPSSPDGAIGSQERNRALGKGRFPWSHSPRFDKLLGLGQSPISAGRRVAAVASASAIGLAKIPSLKARSSVSSASGRNVFPPSSSWSRSLAGRKPTGCSHPKSTGTTQTTSPAAPGLLPTMRARKASPAKSSSGPLSNSQEASELSPARPRHKPHSGPTFSLNTVFIPP